MTYNYTKLEALLMLVNTIDNATSSSVLAAAGTGARSAASVASAPLTLESILANDSLFFNFSLDNISEALEYKQNEYNRDPMAVIITVTVCYAIIFIAGVLGNVITCTVISRNKAMHTATNYYLFNLAVSDLVLLLAGMPNDLYNYWYPSSYPLNQYFCVLQGILSETSTNATVLTITSFTVERYIAICHPFRQHTMSKLSRAVKFIMAIWIIAFCLAIPQAIQYGVVESANNERICTMKNILVRHTFEISSFLFFVGPMTLICILYVLIGVKLRKSKILHGVKRNGSDVRQGVTGQTRVIRMLVAVVVAFFLCWAPFHAQRIMAVYGKVSETKSEIFREIYMVLMYISGVLYFLSTCINPLLYNIMSHKFRDAFKSTLVKHCGLGIKGYNKKNLTYSALSRLGNGNGGSIKLTTLPNYRQSQIENDQQKRSSITRPTPLIINNDNHKNNNANNNDNDNNNINNINNIINNEQLLLNQPPSDKIHKDPLYYYSTNDESTTTTTISTPLSTPPIIIISTHKVNPLIDKVPASISILNEDKIKLPLVADNQQFDNKQKSFRHFRIGASKQNKKFNETNNNKTVKLSTIAERLRRGTKNVFHLKSLSSPGITQEITSIPSSVTTEFITIQQNNTEENINNLNKIKNNNNNNINNKNNNNNNNDDVNNIVNSQISLEEMNDEDDDDDDADDYEDDGLKDNNEIECTELKICE